MVRVFPPIAFLVSVSALVSCASLRNADVEEAARVEKKSSLFGSFPNLPKPIMPDLSLANLMPGPKIKVVEVREKDMKEMPTGTELAKAHRKRGFSNFWPFSGKLYFEEPDFPEPGTDMDDSLLPPKMP